MLFCDTNAWTTGLFHELYLGERSPGSTARAAQYDLTIVCDPRRRSRRTSSARARRAAPAAMHEAYIGHLDETGAPYVVVAGTHAQRMQQATAAVDALLREPAAGAA